MVSATTGATIAGFAGRLVLHDAVCVSNGGGAKGRVMVVAARLDATSIENQKRGLVSEGWCMTVYHKWGAVHRAWEGKIILANSMIVTATILQIIGGAHTQETARDGPPSSSVEHRTSDDELTLAQASITPLVDECRRIALEQQTNSVAEYDAGFLKEKAISETWDKKMKTLLAAAKMPHPAFGTFGNVHAFDEYARSPATIAQNMSIDAKSTLQAVSSALTTLEGQLSVTPDDPVLYCSYVKVHAHCNILRRLSRYLEMHQLTLELMQDYFRLRIALSSTISNTEYQKDRAAINETLLELYDAEMRSDAHLKPLLRMLAKQ
jgi:hypothetical protein